MSKKTYRLIFIKQSTCEDLTLDMVNINDLEDDKVGFSLFKDVNIYAIQIFGKIKMKDVSVKLNDKTFFLPIVENKSFLSINGLKKNELKREYEIKICY